jgi:Na+-transporting NADH:ubiquinone oxidoreductase subunit A
MPVVSNGFRWTDFKQERDMVHIKVTRGLDIPIAGAPLGIAGDLPTPKCIAFNFNFSAFEEVKFRLLVEVGDLVKIGQPLAEDKDVPGRMFVSPGAGIVREIRRGEKRRLLAIVIELASREEYFEQKTYDLERISDGDLIDILLRNGLFSHIRVRPFYRLPNPKFSPRAIFIKAIETAPFVPPAEMQVQGREAEFEAGLKVLRRLTKGPIHLVYRAGTTSKPFLEAEHCEKHTVEGPHPAGTSSVHIQAIDPIKRPDDVIWTLTTLGVIHIGSFLLHGRLSLERIISIAGTGVLPDKRQYIRARFGHPVEDLVRGRLIDGPTRIISGDVLTGDRVTTSDFLGFSHTVLTVIPDEAERLLLPFCRLGTDQYTASHAYLSGFFNWLGRRFPFTTAQHGERRAFMDSRIYEKVIPLRILPLHLIRACMVSDYELAVKYGLLEVAPEDFALAEFVDPSKIEIMDIVRNALRNYSHDVM